MPSFSGLRLAARKQATLLAIDAKLSLSTTTLYRILREAQEMVDYLSDFIQQRSLRALKWIITQNVRNSSRAAKAAALPSIGLTTSVTTPSDSIEKESQKEFTIFLL